MGGDAGGNVGGGGEGGGGGGGGKGGSGVDGGGGPEGGRFLVTRWSTSSMVKVLFATVGSPPPAQ